MFYKAVFLRRTIATFTLAVVATFGLVATGFGQVAAEDAKQTRFEELLQQIQTDPGGSTDAEAIELMQLAKKANKLYPTSLAMKGFLSHHFRPDARALLLSAQTAQAVSDHRTSVARYKKYLKLAADTAESGEAAGNLMMVMIDDLKAIDDAYQTLATQLGKHRKHDLARKFDTWFLEQTKTRKDFRRMSEFLAVVLAEKMPLEKERLYYWRYLDWLMTEVSLAHPVHYPSIEHVRKIVPLVRGDALRTKRYAFYLANLEFQATSIGQDQRRLEEQFKTVLATSKTYFDANAGYGAAIDVLQVFFSHRTHSEARPFDAERFKRTQPQCAAFFSYMFGRLADIDKRRMLDYRGWEYFAKSNSEQLVAFAEQHAAFFAKSSYTAAMYFPYSGLPKSMYVRQAKLLKGVPSIRAAVINSLAASDEIDGVINHWAKNETWHSDLAGLGHNFTTHVWPAFSKFEREKLLPASVYRNAYLTMGDHVAASPAAIFETGLLSSYMSNSFHYDRPNLVKRINSLAWIPLSDAKRKSIFDSAYTPFQSWADTVRKVAAANKEPIPPETVKLITSIDKALSAARSRTTPDLTKAPNPISRKMAELVLAERANNWTQFAVLGQQMYPLVKGFESKKTPYGRAIVAYLLSKTDPATIDMRVAILRDYLTRIVPGGDNGHVGWVARSLAYGGPAWAWSGSPVVAKPQLQKVNKAFEDALMTLLNRNQFDPGLFRWFLGTRAGSGWKEYEWGLPVAEKMLASKLFHRVRIEHDSSTSGNVPFYSATTTYMWLIGSHFRTLKTKYPLETYFDDMLVEEMNRTKFLDDRYWSWGGKDEQKKVVNAAAKLITAMPALPLEYGSMQFGLSDIPHMGGMHHRVPLGWKTNAVALRPSWFFNWQQKALEAEPAIRDAMIKSIEAKWGTTRFDVYAMGRSYFQNNNSTLDEEDVRKEFFERVAAYGAKQKTVPNRIPPSNMKPLSGFDAETVTNAELDVLKGLLPGCVPAYWTGGLYFHEYARVLERGLITHGRSQEIAPIAPHMWSIGRSYFANNYYRTMVANARELSDAAEIDGRYELALVYATSGIDRMKTSLPINERIQLQALRNANLSKIGGVIPVRKSDPRYPIFAAQSNFLTGRFQTAWETYLKNKQLVEEVHRDLDPSFSLWLIDRNINTSKFEDATKIAQLMLVWFDSVEGGFDPEVRARLMLMYGNISLAQKEFPKARAQFSRIVAAREFDGTRAKADAELSVANVDRLQGRYDSALEIITRVSERDDPVVQVAAFLAMARVKFDQEEYEEAKTSLNDVFTRNSEHEEARILEGRVNLALKKIEEVIEIEIGSVTLQRIIVPGKPLKISLEDKNLAIVGKSTDIEIRAWTKSGDEEFFSLLPFGDSKTKFRGQIDTELAETSKGDKVLQLLGRDEVHYDFSDAFKKENKVVFGKPPSLTVATDGGLYGSSGTIRTPEELEAEALEKLILQRLGEIQSTGQPVVVQPLSARRSHNQVKPGNKVNLRVVDHDRSTTEGVDQLAVRVSAGSGDRIVKFLLTETAEYSGVFEASVQTRSSQAIAFATDSQDGRDPNFAISPKQYPAWAAVSDGIKPKFFGVDLNKNVALGKLSVTAREPGQLLKSFAVEVSFNGKTFTRVGSWPTAYKPWDGTLTLQVCPAPSMDELPTSGGAIASYLTTSYITDEVKKVSLPVAEGLIDAVWNGNNVEQFLLKTRKVATTLIMKSDDDYYVAHFRGAFHQKHRRLRTLHIQHNNSEEDAVYFLQVNEVLSSGSTFKASLPKGVHIVDVYMAARKGATPNFKLMWDTLEEPFEEVVPADAFSLAKNPQIKEAIYVPPAEVTANEDGTEFTIDFDRSTHGRVVRLMIDDYEISAPAINKLKLTNRADKVLLPTEHDFRDLWENNELEIISGDKVTITYVDPSSVTRGNDVHEVSLTATYTNGNIQAAYGRYTAAGTTQKLNYVMMRRYKPIKFADIDDPEADVDPVFVLIKDPDLDVSDKLDTVKFQASSFANKPIELLAVETDRHSGVFVGKVFPIETASFLAARKSAAGAGKKNNANALKLAKNQILVEDDDEIRISYLDRENVDPGVAWVRTTSVEQVWYKDPEVRIFDVTSRSLTKDEIDELPENDPDEQIGLLEEFVPTRFMMTSVWPEEPNRKEPAKAVIGGPVPVEVIFPYVALSPDSFVEIFVQTRSGRELYNGELKKPFDLDVPGTLRLTAGPTSVGSGSLPPGYRNIVVRSDPYAVAPLEDGRFGVNIPIKLAETPPVSYAFAKAEDTFDPPPSFVSVKGDDELFIGFKYKDEEGKQHWVTQSIEISGDSFFDVMERRYQQHVSGLYVGQSAYFRVIDPSRDLTDEKDVIKVFAKTSSGRNKTFELVETYSHSGIFKGLVNLVYDGSHDKPAAKPAAGAKPKPAAKPASTEEKEAEAELSGERGTVQSVELPVTYGDLVTFSYNIPDSDLKIEQKLDVFKGADGSVLPFTKRFNDQEIAVQTQFTIAEAYFELAKRHRELGQHDISRAEIAQGKKLLEEAIRDYPKTKAKVQADYLLANLSLEFAKDTEDAKASRKLYTEAVARFSAIVSTYPDSTYAPKCQYKKAQSLEKMGDIDQACEEYVKLSYRYPAHELIADTIASLGQYFHTKGLQMKKEAAEQEDPIEAEKILTRSKDMFKTAAEVFARLAPRFPDHKLAELTSVRSAQCYMRAELYEDAVKTFKRIIDSKNADKDLRAEAMYWCADSFTRLKKPDFVSAYRVFKPLTWEYPESKWAKYARGRLATGGLSKIDAAGGETPQ